MTRFFRPAIVGGMLVLSASSAVLAQSCTGPAAVQVLGPGGPAINPERASASYLL